MIACFQKHIVNHMNFTLSWNWVRVGIKLSLSSPLEKEEHGGRTVMGRGAGKGDEDEETLAE